MDEDANDLWQIENCLQKSKKKISLKEKRKENVTNVLRISVGLMSVAHWSNAMESQNPWHYEALMSNSYSHLIMLVQMRTWNVQFSLFKE